jgi:uncharacterized membrane protein YkoI
MRRSLMLVLVVALAALVFAAAAFAQDDNPSADDPRGDDRGGPRGFDDNPSGYDLGADDNGGADSEERLTGPDAQKAESAAIAAVGGGTVTEVERDDGDDGYGTGGGAYEVEVTRDDGSQVEVHLDGHYDVVGQEADEDGPNDNDGPNDD